ncbi:MAG: hypothetical protein AAFV53_26135 [Myxococcota bacterium]
MDAVANAILSIVVGLAAIGLVHPGWGVLAGLLLFGHLLWNRR